MAMAERETRNVPGEGERWQEIESCLAVDSIYTAMQGCILDAERALDERDQAAAALPLMKSIVMLSLLKEMLAGRDKNKLAAQFEKFYNHLSHVLRDVLKRGERQDVSLAGVYVNRLQTVWRREVLADFQGKEERIVVEAALAGS